MKRDIEQSHGLQTMSSELKNAKNYHRWLMSKVEPYLNNRVLEIGIGDGSYTEFIKDKDLIVGIDIAHDCVDYCKNKFSDDKNIKCLQANFLEDDLSYIKSQNLDSAFCFNVLEHVEDHLQFLKNVRSLVGDNSYFVIIVPAVSYIYGEMDRLAGHHRRYNMKDLVSLSEEANWKVAKVEYINFLGGLGWFLNKFKKPKTLSDDSINKQIIFFDKFILPITKFCDFFTKKFFGQSLIIILKK